MTQLGPDARQALIDAYWKLRDHAEAYRNTTPVRKVRERWENTGRRDQELGRTAAINEFYARGIEAAARDLAEMLGIPEHEIERPDGAVTS